MFNSLEFQKPGVYIIRNKVNGKFYIGSTERSFRVRFREHISDSKNRLKRSCLLYYAINKYGLDNFSFEILVATENISHISRLEQTFIDSMKPEYNIAKFVDKPLKGLKFSDEHRKKISINRSKFKASDQARKNMSISHVGKKHSEECKTKKSIIQKNKWEDKTFREKMSIALSGNKCSDEKKNKISNSLLGRKHTPERIANLKKAWVKRKAIKNANIS